MKVRIGTAEELLRALEGGEPPLQLAVLRMVRRAPEHALGFGAWQGRDVVDALADLGRQGSDVLAMDALDTLCGYDGERPLRFFIDQLAGAQGPRIEIAQAWLETHAHPREALYPALMQNESLRRARAAAGVLGPAGEVDPRDVAVRLALLASDDGVLPPFEGPFVALYISELGGVAAAEAKAALESLAAWPALVETRRSLPAPAVRWLLEWGVRVAPERVVDLLEEALADEALADLALDCVSRLGAGERLETALDRLLSTGRPDQRRRAAQLGAGDTTALLSDPEPAVRAAAMGRADVGTARLVDGLRDDDWRVRAAASEALAGRGAAAVPLVRPLLDSVRTEERAAAVQVLAALGDEIWLEEALL